MNLRKAINYALEIANARAGELPKWRCFHCGEERIGKQFPVTLAGGDRIIGYICRECLTRLAEELREEAND